METPEERLAQAETKLARIQAVMEKPHWAPMSPDHRLGSSLDMPYVLVTDLRAALRDTETEAPEAKDQTEPDDFQAGPVTLINVHPASACAGRACCIHNPSDHRLAQAPMNWRADLGIMERLCEHGIGHPDADDVAYHASQGSDWIAVHGCDGCC